MPVTLSLLMDEFVQELQSLAKETNGVVRANVATSDLVKELRKLGITANA